MAQSPELPPGWRDLSFEDRGLLLTLAFGSKPSVWHLGATEMCTRLGVSIGRAQQFIDAAIAAEVLVASNGAVALNEPSDNLKKWWARKFDEVFWPAVTTPWKKVGRANALKVWKTNTFALIRPKTEAAAEILLELIMQGVGRYRLLLVQPNAPQMKYPEGWLSGQRWQDEIDERFIEQHARPTQAAAPSSPLERARRVQAEQQLVLEQGRQAALPSLRLEVNDDNSLPEFVVSL